jgi:acetyl-CoA C-acetyltransferase
VSQREIVISQPVRTALGTYGGSLQRIPATELGATTIGATLGRSGMGATAVDGVVFGQVVQAGAKMNPARQAAVNAGLAHAVPAMTVNRVCGSGAQAIVSAASEIRAGEADCLIAGGMENMDRAPYLDPGARWGHRLGPAQILDSLLTDGLNDAFSGQHAGWHTEDLASAYGIDREAQDAWAARSHQRFSAAQAAGHFDAEIAPVEITGGRGTTTFARDEHNRPDTTAEGLAGLRPAFRREGSITPGNAPGLNTGAAALVVAERSQAERNGLVPTARLVGHGVAGVDPDYFGIAPVPATRLALERAGWAIDDVERIEINEAFAAVPLACMGELDLDPERVNVDGGAVAHGHPIGATGAVLTTRLLHSMARDGLTRGIVTLCIGGGQGIALALERVSG